MKYIAVALTTPVEGREDEFNEWYDTVHLRDVLSAEGVISAERFEVASGKTSHRYMAFYEVEAENPRAVWAALNGMQESMVPTDTIAEAGAYLLAPMGVRLVDAT